MRLTREELFRQIWAEPLRIVAARYDLSGNGLAKICDRLAIPRPPRTHWTRAEADRDPLPDLPPPPVGLSEEIALGKQPTTRRAATGRTRLDREARREQLMDVGSRIAVEEGVSAITMRRLAQDVGVSETQVHNCFGGRIDLLIAMAEREIAAIESERRHRVDRNSDRHTLIVLSTTSYLHQAAQRGPLLQMLLYIPEVREGLQSERASRTRVNRAPILDRLTRKGHMSAEDAAAATEALTAITLRAGGIVAARRADFAVVEQMCLALVMAGVRANDRMAAGS